MKKLLLLWLVFTIGCQPKTTRYVHYHNERFGFELDYPSFMKKDPPPENGDGIRCQGRGMELVAYGSINGGVILTLELTYHQEQVDSATINHVLKSFCFQGIY